MSSTLELRVMVKDVVYIFLTKSDYLTTGARMVLEEMRPIRSVNLEGLIRVQRRRI